MRLWAERTHSLPGKIVVPIVGQSLRLSVPLLGIILLLPLLKLPENWTWVTQKAVGILFIVTLSFLIVHGINAMQAALLSRQRLDLPDNLSARRIYTQVSVISKVIIAVVIIIATGSVLMLFDPVRQFGNEYFGFRWNCRNRDRFRRATDSRQCTRRNSDRVNPTAAHR